MGDKTFAQLVLSYPNSCGTVSRTISDLNRMKQQARTNIRRAVKIGDKQLESSMTIIEAELDKLLRTYNE